MTTRTGLESSLSPWAGPYVTDMLGKTKALAEEPYTPFKGELVAGASPLQAQAFQGLASLGVPQATTTGSFIGTPYTPPTSDSILNPAGGSGLPAGGWTYSQNNPGFTATPEQQAQIQADVDASMAGRNYFDSPAQSQGLGTGIMGLMQQPNIMQQYMNPYLQGALAPQYAQAQKDYQKAQRDLQGQYARAGAYGGSRQGVAEGELMSGALQNLSGITGRGYEQAYADARDMFKEDREYGLGLLKDKADMGKDERNIRQQGNIADIAQFEAERDDPFKKLQFQQSMLQGLPISTQAYNYTQPSSMQQAASGAGGVLDLMDKLGFDFGSIWT
tara:strand:- start:4111 stop:5103 length:993 start_codon:yes stop_codon:yes gene_type:complete